MHSGEVLSSIILAAYGLAVILYLWALIGKAKVLGKTAFKLAVIGIAIQGISIIVQSIQLHRPPFTVMESITFTAWAMMVIGLAMEYRYRITVFGAFASMVGVIVIASSLILPGNSPTPMLAMLQNQWSAIHIASCLIAYASFALAFIAAMVYMLQDRMLKAKRINTLQQSLPPLDLGDRLAYKMVAFGFPMLTLGVITGALWAQTAWGKYWQWDPKETWALITWLVYAAYLHLRLVRGERGKWANRLLVVGFACVLLTFFGTNLLPYGLHKYGW